MRLPALPTPRPILAGLLSIAATATLGTAVTTLAAATPAAAAAAAAHSVPLLDRMPAGIRARMVGQGPLVDAASIIRTAVRAGQPRGYAGLGLVGDHVVLWWHGAPPADIATAVAAAQHIAPVTVTRAAYSSSQLKVAAARLGASVGAEAAHGVRIKTDGSGLELLIDRPTIASRRMLQRAGVPAAVVPAPHLYPRSTRMDDAAPWSGGTSIIRNPGVLCTAGFGVRDLSTDTPYLVTAGHCGQIGDVWRDRTGEEIGATTLRNPDHDDELIATSAVSNKIYIGRPDDGFRARVVGWTEVFPGQLLCQSGNTSAEVTGAPVCNLQVQFHYTDTENLVEATQLDGYTSARGGDSGGPVYSVTGQGMVLVAGTSTRAGGAGFGFQDFATYREDFGDLVPVTVDGTGSCRVSYQITDSWAGGYVVNATVYNSGADVTGWQVTWELPERGEIQGHWNAQFSQTGTDITASNESFNATIVSGAAVTFGFTATGAPVVPGPVELNGVTCS